MTIPLPEKGKKTQTMDHHQYHWFSWPWNNKYCHSQDPPAHIFFSETSWNTANPELMKHCIEATDLRSTTVYLISQKISQSALARHNLQLKSYVFTSKDYTIGLVISVAMFVKAVLCAVASSTKLTPEHTNRNTVLVTDMSTQTWSGTQVLSTLQTGQSMLQRRTVHVGICHTFMHHCKHDRNIILT